MSPWLLRWSVMDSCLSYLVSITAPRCTEWLEPGVPLLDSLSSFLRVQQLSFLCSCLRPLSSPKPGRTVSLEPFLSPSDLLCQVLPAFLLHLSARIVNCSPDCVCPWELELVLFVFVHSTVSDFRNKSICPLNADMLIHSGLADRSLKCLTCIRGRS